MVAAHLSSPPSDFKVDGSHRSNDLHTDVPIRERIVGPSTAESEVGAAGVTAEPEGAAGAALGVTGAAAAVVAAGGAAVALAAAGPGSFVSSHAANKRAPAKMKRVMNDVPFVMGPTGPAAQ